MTVPRVDEITTERTGEGAWCLIAVVDGVLRTRRYYGFTKRQAIAQYRRECKDDAAL